MKLLFILSVIITLAGACADSTNNTNAASQQDTAIVKNYFPVNDFIHNEIAFADSFFTTFIKYTTYNNKTDSVYLKPAEFKQLAAEFNTRELSKEALEKDYTEASFLDQTTGAYTFTYSTPNPNLAFQRIDVLASSGEGFDKISSIYIEKITSQGDTLTRKKVYWKSGKSFQVITETSVKSQAPQTEQYKVVWDPSE